MPIPDKIKECYAIEDDLESLSCIKKEIREYKGDCKPKMVLLTRPGCSGCAESKEHYKDDIARGLVTILDIKSTEGAAIARKNDVDTVPALLILDCNNNPIV